MMFALGGILSLFALAAAGFLVYERWAQGMQALEETGRLYARYATNRLYENYASSYIYGTTAGQERFAEQTRDMLALNSAVVGVRLLGPAGEVLFDSRRDGGEEVDEALRHLAQELAATSTTDDPAMIVRRGRRDGEPVLRVIRPYSPGGIVLAVAVYDLSLSTVHQRALAASLVVLLGTAAFFALLGLALSWIVSRAVLKPVTVLSAAAQALGHGFLDAGVATSGGSEEMNVLARAFQAMAGDLKGTVAKLSTLGDQVASTSDAILRAGNEVTEGTSRQATQTRQTEAALEQLTRSSREASERAVRVAELGDRVKNSVSEMTLSTEQIAQSSESLGSYVDRTHDSIMEINGSVNEVSRSAEVLRSLADDAAGSVSSLHSSIERVREQAERSRAHSQSAHQEATALGASTVDEAVAGIDRLREIVDRAVGIIETLSHRSEEVGRIATLIDEVTDRTNLLGINASIMAAQAGEHGAGFAVVADEIKSLSLQIAASTRDIARLLTSMRQEAEAAVSVIREGSQSAAESVRLSEGVRDVLARIVEHSAETGRMLAGVAEATESQGESTRQLKALADRLAGMARETAEAACSQQSFSSRIVDATDGVRALAEQVARSTQEHSRNAHEVADAMRQLGAGVEAITDAVRHQLEQAEPIRGALREIRYLAEGNRGRSASMSQTVTALATRADSLRAELSRFRFQGAPESTMPAIRATDAGSSEGASLDETQEGGPGRDEGRETVYGPGDAPPRPS
jgi:methyl-accepting chemotaxis protein